MKTLNLVSKEKISELITGGDYICKLARISYFSNLSFKDLEQTKIEFNSEGIPYLVFMGEIPAIKPINEEILPDIQFLIDNN